MRQLKQLAIVLLLSTPLWSQTTAVTATLTDSDGQTWNNGSFSVVFVPTPGTPGPFTWTGGITFPQKFTGTMSAGGVLTVSLPDNNFIAPKGSKWQFTLCSNTSAPCVNVVTPVSGASIDLSSLLSNNIVAPRFAPGANAFGYLDLEVIGYTPPNNSLLPGANYFNVTSQLTRQWTGSAWVNVGGGVAGNPANPSGGIQGNNAGVFGSIPNASYNLGTGAISLASLLTVSNGISVSNGGSLSGSFTGNPTLSGNPVFSGNPNFNGTNTFNGSALFTNFVPGRPVGIGSGGLMSSSLRYWDCSEFTGASLDIILNTCMGYVITAGGGTADTRALPTGNLNAQFNAWAEGPAPLITTSSSGGNLANGTYRIAYTLNSTGCNTECTASEEAIITTTGAGVSTITVPPPPYPGTATTYNVYCTAGASWTETKCASNVGIGGPVTITTSVGWSTAISKLNAQVEVILPSAPFGTFLLGGNGWQCNITAAVATYVNQPTTPSGLLNCLKWGDRSNVHGAGMGEGHRWQVQNGSGSTNVYAIVGSSRNAKTGQSYFRIDGFSANGAANSSVATVSSAVCDVENFPDATFGAALDCIAGNNQTALIIYGNGGGAGATFYSMHGECSFAANCLPCKIGNVGPSASIATIGLGCVHAGAGTNELAIQSGSGNLNLWNTYVESGGSDTTTPLVDVGGVGGVGGGVGPVHIDGLGAEVDNASSTAPLVQIESQTLTSVIMEGLFTSRHSNVLIKDLITGTTVTCPGQPCMYTGPYETAKGNGSALNAALPGGLTTGGGITTGGPSPFFAQGTTALPTGALAANTCAATTAVPTTGVTSAMKIGWQLHGGPVGAGYASSPVVIWAWTTAASVNFLQCATAAVSPAAISVDWVVY